MVRKFRSRPIVFSTFCFVAACPTVLFSQTSKLQPITSLPKPPSICAVTDPQPNSAPKRLPSCPTAYTLPTYSPPQPAAIPDLRPPLHAAIANTIALPIKAPHFHPFSGVGVEITMSFSGGGVDLATPLTQHLNLRGGGSFITYAPSYSTDGINIAGRIDLSSANISLDWYPFMGSFRISPGVTVYNGNSVNATLSVPAGQTFSLGDGDYTSSPSNPVHGIVSMSLGKPTVPSFTIGWGNMIPYNDRNFTVPFAIGFQYIGAPKINFNLSGTACNNLGCSDIAADPISQADLQREITNINNDIGPLRFYPIISIGFAWAFRLRSMNTR